MDTDCMLGDTQSFRLRHAMAWSKSRLELTAGLRTWASICVDHHYNHRSRGLLHRRVRVDQRRLSADGYPPADGGSSVLPLGARKGQLPDPP